MTDSLQRVNSSRQSCTWCNTHGRLSMNIIWGEKSDVPHRQGETDDVRLAHSLSLTLRKTSPWVTTLERTVFLVCNRMIVQPSGIYMWRTLVASGRFHRDSGAGVISSRANAGKHVHCTHRLLSTHLVGWSFGLSTYKRFPYKQRTVAIVQLLIEYLTVININERFEWLSNQV